MNPIIESIWTAFVVTYLGHLHREGWMFNLSFMTVNEESSGFWSDNQHFINSSINLILITKRNN